MPTFHLETHARRSLSPLMNPCAKCSAVGSLNYCGRCERAPYCSKECQVAHWAVHKRTCVTPAQCKKGIEMAIQRIIGNIIVMLSHYSMEGRPMVVVRIDETIEEFTKGDCTVHIAHLSCVEIPPSAAPSPHSCTPAATFVFKNFTTEVDLNIPPGRPMKAPQYTGGIWSVVFDM